MTITDREQAQAVRLAFVQSTWHEEIVDQCRDSFIEEIAGLGVSSDRIDLFRVPGAFEIPSTPSDWPAAGCMRQSSAPAWWSTGESIVTTSSPRPSSTG